MLMMAAVAIVRDGSLAGHQMPPAPADEAPTVAVAPDGTITVNTSEIGRGYTGYAGATPLKVTIADGRIKEIEPLPNPETPDFFARATDKVLPAYIGLTVDEALTADVDGATGATLSSNALKENIRAACKEAHAAPTSQTAVSSPNDLHPFRGIDGNTADWCVLIVTLCGAILPWFVKDRRYRFAQLVANVAVLGFWGGTFLSYARMVGWMANGMALPALLAPAVMLVAAFIYPLFGRPNHYCTWICPLGSLQELAGKCTKRKWRLSKGLVNTLTWVRRLLWCALMTMMWLGAGFAWMDYELFAAFIVESAAWWLMALAAAVIVLSVFIPRPFCRFLCPTGTLFKIAESYPK